MKSADVAPCKDDSDSDSTSSSSSSSSDDSSTIDSDFGDDITEGLRMSSRVRSPGFTANIAPTERGDAANVDNCKVAKTTYISKASVAEIVKSRKAKDAIRRSAAICKCFHITIL